MGFLSVEQEPVDSDRAVLGTRHRSVPVYPHDGIGNCAGEWLLPPAAQLSNTQAGVKNGSAELAETGNAPTWLSQIKAKCTHCFVFTILN